MANIIDKIVGFFNPKAGLEREILRKQFDQIQTQRAYEANGHGFRNVNKNFTSRASPTFTAATNGAELRALSRDYNRNFAYAKRANNALSSKVVGKGIRPSFTVKNSKGQRSKQLEDNLKNEWNAWADKNGCDFNGILNLYAIQRQVMRTVIESGECLILRYVTKDNKLQLRVLEPDMIDGNKNTAYPYGTANEYDFCGLRFTKEGKPLGVYVFLNNPTYTNTQESTFVSFENIHLAFYQERAGQFRGTPFAVASFTELDNLHKYQDATVTKAFTAACFSIYIKKPRSSNTLAGAMINNNCDAPPLEFIEPGTIQYLNPDEDVITADPPSNDGHADFHNTSMLGIAAGWGLAPHSITGDFSRTNFSSGRLAAHAETDTIELLQDFVMKPFMEKVGKWWSDLMKLTRQYSGTLTIEWTMPSKPITDPYREVTALVDRLKNGLISPQEALRELGYDPDDVLTETSEYMKKADNLNLKFEYDMRGGEAKPRDTNISDEEENEL